MSAAKYIEDAYPLDAIAEVSSGVGEPLFVVTSIVGAVFAGGQYPPRVAAFMLIAESGGTGEFSFPNEDGTTTIVGVVTEPTKEKLEVSSTYGKKAR